MEKLTKYYTISFISIIVSYFLINNLLKPDPHINNFISMFIVRVLFIIIGFVLIIYNAITNNNKIISNYLFIITLLINLTSIIEVIFTLSEKRFFYLLMSISILVAFVQIFLTLRYLKNNTKVIQ